jgi:hypothetical protein
MFHIEKQQILPALLIVFDIVTAVVYCKYKDWSHVGYWISAAAITFFATFKL